MAFDKEGKPVDCCCWVAIQDLINPRWITWVRGSDPSPKPPMTPGTSLMMHPKDVSCNCISFFFIYLSYHDKPPDVCFCVQGPQTKTHKKKQKTKPHRILGTQKKIIYLIIKQRDAK